MKRLLALLAAALALPAAAFGQVPISGLPAAPSLTLADLLAVDKANPVAPNGRTTYQATLSQLQALIGGGSSITLPLSLANGGTGTALTASAGGVPYLTGSAFAILPGTATAGQCLTSGSNAAPSWATCGAGGGITALTGDVSASGSGSVAATLATVNSNTGAFGSGSAIPNFTVNAKGLITAAGTSSIAAPVSGLTGAGSGVATALANTVNAAGGVVLYSGALGTPTSGNGANLTGLVYTALPALSANQVLGALTATTPSGLSVPSCSGATNALTWTSGTGFGCNTISSGSGTVSSGTINNLAIYTGTTTVGSATTGTGVVTALGNALNATGGLAPVTSPTLTNATVTGSFNAAGLVTLADHAIQGASTVIGNSASIAASPTALAVPSCYSASSALNWTPGGSFSCNQNMITSGNSPNNTITTDSLSNNINVDINLANPNTWTGIQTFTGGVIATGLEPLTNLVIQGPNTIVANATGIRASPTAIAVPNCNGASNALIWTAGAGFSCNSISGSGAVNSVSDSGAGTLTISPTTGVVLAALNLGNANTWTAAQTFNANDLILGGVTGGGTQCLQASNAGVVTGTGSACGAGGGGTPGGFTGQMQFNNAGTFGGTPLLTIGANNTLAIPNGAVLRGPDGTIWNNAGYIYPKTSVINFPDGGSWTSGGIATTSIHIGSFISYLTSAANYTIQIGQADTTFPQPQIIRTQSATGSTDLNVGALKIVAPLATGAGTSGTIQLQTGPTGSSGTTQAPATTAVTINTPAGTATLPTLAFNNCGTNCGFYSAGSGKLDLAISGSKVFDYNDTTASTLTLTIAGVTTTGVLMSGTNLYLSSNTARFGWQGRPTYMSSPAAGSIQFGDVDGTSPATMTLRFQSQITTANTAPGNATIQGPLSTGNASADIVFSTTNNSAGSTTQNTATTALTLKGGTHLVYTNSATQILGTNTTITGGSTGNTPTLTAGPVTGNPTKWLPYDDNGTTRYIPAW